MENNVFSSIAANAANTIQQAAEAQGQVAQAAQDSVAARVAFNEQMTEAQADKTASDGEASIAQGDLNHIDQMAQAQAR